MSDIIIDVKNLGKQYGKHMAVENISFHINRGMICGLICLGYALFRKSDMK